MKTKNLPNTSSEARRWIKSLREEFRIVDAHREMLLGQLAESFDRLREAQKILSAEGLTVKDRWQQPRMHPACIIERDCRNALLKTLKDLGLDAATVPGTNDQDKDAF
jgi:P27 family predicted phage terminase small subunit